MQHLMNDYRSEVTALALNGEMNAPYADAMELTLRRADFHGFIEGLVIDQDVFMRCKVLRGTRVEDPMLWIAALAVVLVDIGFSHSFCRRTKSYSSFRCCCDGWLRFVLQMRILCPACRFDVPLPLAMGAK